MAVQIVSIGLNVGDSEPERQEEKTRAVLTWLHAGLRAIEVVVTSGIWEEIPERTLQARIVSDSGAQFGSSLCYYASLLKQDAIAYTYPGSGEWMLAHSNGAITRGGSVEEFPVLFDVQVTRGDPLRSAFGPTKAERGENSEIGLEAAWIQRG